ncbi:MAG: thioredoxin [Planctomycetes bacterium]|nr:thioredoxin [Planctomycetota bacterium]
MDTAPTPVTVTLDNFETEVLQRSTEVPVLLDFWATWCGPCKALGPTLEQLERELAGRFVLAKCDVDENPELAQAFRIQSVPTVVLLVEGRPVDAFAGALPAAQIRAFLEPHLGAAPGGPEDLLAEALELEQAGDLEAAQASLEELLADAPEEAAPRVALARVLLARGEEPAARKVFERLAEAERGRDDAKALQARFDLMASAGDLDAKQAAAEAAPDDLAKRLEYGRALVAAGRVEDGLEELFTAAKRDLAYDGGAPRKALLEVFQALGPQDPRTLEYQQRLSVLLCS